MGVGLEGAAGARVCGDDPMTKLIDGMEFCCVADPFKKHRVLRRNFSGWKVLNAYGYECMCGTDEDILDLFDRGVYVLPASSSDMSVAGVMPTDAAARKAVPIATGVIDYFPDAIAAVAAVSKVGGEQHNPGRPLFWDRTKSGDESDALMRHFLERGRLDTDGQRHSAKVAWRALALLQKEIEAKRAL